MYKKLVKELMVPVVQYPTVHQDASMFEALMAIRKGNENIPIGQQQYRAVLVYDNDNKIVGKIGQLSFLKALEPKYKDIFDLDKLSRLSLSSSFIDTMQEQFSLWSDENIDLCNIAINTKCKEIMKPIEQHIDQNESIAQAIHKLVMWQTLSILVTDGEEIVGIIRLSDIYSSIEDFIVNSCNTNK